MENQAVKKKKKKKNQQQHLAFFSHEAHWAFQWADHFGKVMSEESPNVHSTENVMKLNMSSVTCILDVYFLIAIKIYLVYRSQEYW